ncbi:unnamed protein product [Mycena citricolor]|uniref:Uncharacterized protein n=1 Tax=Mycena citricolor TaxID=2018698 RepID=A0AAD2H8K8_9AGAR|nr:unnamed protein product [Mycena citricolor]
MRHEIHPPLPPPPPAIPTRHLPQHIARMSLWVQTDASSWLDTQGSTAIEQKQMKVLSLGRVASVDHSLDVEIWTAALNSRFFANGIKMEADDWHALLGSYEIAMSRGQMLSQELAQTAASPPPTPSKLSNAKRPTLITKLGRNKPFVISSCLDPRFLDRLRPFFKVVWMTFFGDFPSTELAQKRFDFDQAQARTLMVEYKAGEGWERVCLLLHREPDSDSDSELASSSDEDDSDLDSDGAGNRAFSGDVHAFRRRMHKLTYGLFQGLGGTVVMQTALVGSMGVSLSFAHRASPVPN